MTDDDDYKIDWLQDYDLTQAFWKLGQRLFDKDWSLNFDELQIRRPPPNTAILKSTIEFYQGEADEISKLIDAKRNEIAKTVDEFRISEIQNEIQELSSTRTAIWQVITNLPTLDDTTIRSWKTYWRRRETESALIAALRSGELRAWTHSRMVLIGHNHWQPRKGFCYSIERSQIRLPRF
ncbi:MAG: hypothetical protein SFV21_02975, partial [Rhodospirillaceae bacterium]|nr:hypothetical protein [Rhodospirillaceae bacterium]